MHEPMQSSEPQGEIRDIAEAAFALMKSRGFPPTPKNYALWYAYFSKADPELTRTLERVLKSGNTLTERRIAELYSQFFEIDMEAEAIRQTGALIEASMTKMLARMDEMQDSADRYGRSLDTYSGRLGRSTSPDELRSVIGMVLLETHRMRERADEIAGDIRQTSAEIVELKQNLESVRREAYTDGLTGIANRRAFDVRLEQALREAAEADEPLSLLMIDIDHFKRFNDRFGHPMGDKVLQLVARVLKQSVKGQDVVARYGGEEFAVILPKTGLKGATSLAEQLKTAVASRRIVDKRSGEDFGAMTLSIGVAAFRRGERRHNLVKRADAALYLAKKRGRNRVVTEEAAPQYAAS